MTTSTDLCTKATTSYVFGAPSATALSATSLMSVASAMPVSAVAMWAAIPAVAAAAVRPAFGRIAASAHAWDTNGGAPSFQAYACTGYVTDHLSNEIINNTETANGLTKTVKTNAKTKKRPPSWSGPPNG